jgi:hypothetical protein
VISILLPPNALNDPLFVVSAVTTLLPLTLIYKLLSINGDTPSSLYQLNVAGIGEEDGVIEGVIEGVLEGVTLGVLVTEGVILGVGEGEIPGKGRVISI